MIILGISAEHNSSACLMRDGKVLGLVQEERLTKLKNQCAFPLLAIKELVNTHLEGEFTKIDEVVYGTLISDPYYTCLDRYSTFEIEDHIKEMNEMWYPHFYKNKAYDGSYWRNKFLNNEKINLFHNYDLSFLKRDITVEEAIKYFNDVERVEVVKRYLPHIKEVHKKEHHKCHAYFALYGGELENNKIFDTLVLTADAWGDYSNWSVSTVNKDGTLKKIAEGTDFQVARIYKYCTLILGMKPNEHEYKVMGLSGYSKSKKHIKAVEKIFYELLDFENGEFIKQKPLIDCYFDLKKRLEGHRFDNIAAGLQNWSSQITYKWANYWIEKTKKTNIAFSGGLSMNIKANGDILNNPKVNYISVPPSGGDESLSAGACFALALENKANITPISSPYLGNIASENDKEQIFSRLQNTSFSEKDFEILEGFDAKKLAKLLSMNVIFARCSGRAEFGARALGNRSILANPREEKNVKKINDLIKNRDFWMPFTPSILEEHSSKYLINPKNITSYYMTIGFETTDLAKKEIPACLHLSDFSARPQFVNKKLNYEYWNLINEFFIQTNIPCLLNTSLNLHGEPMNYSLADSVRTLALSSLDYLSIPNDRLIIKKKAKGFLLGMV